MITELGEQNITYCNIFIKSDGSLSVASVWMVIFQMLF